MAFLEFKTMFPTSQLTLLSYFLVKWSHAFGCFFLSAMTRLVAAFLQRRRMSLMSLFCNAQLSEKHACIDKRHWQAWTHMIQMDRTIWNPFLIPIPKQHCYKFCFWCSFDTVRGVRKQLYYTEKCFYCHVHPIYIFEGGSPGHHHQVRPQWLAWLTPLWQCHQNMRLLRVALVTELLY